MTKFQKVIAFILILFLLSDICGLYLNYIYLSHIDSKIENLNNNVMSVKDSLAISNKHLKEVEKYTDFIDWTLNHHTLSVGF